MVAHVDAAPAARLAAAAPHSTHGSEPQLACPATTVPRGTSLPAAGSVLMTVPCGCVESTNCCVDTRPARFSAVLALPSAMPTTSGTRTRLPLDTTSRTSVPTATLVPAAGSLRTTVPAGCDESSV